MQEEHRRGNTIMDARPSCANQPTLNSGDRREAEWEAHDLLGSDELKRQQVKDRQAGGGEKGTANGHMRKVDVARDVPRVLPHSSSSFSCYSIAIVGLVVTSRLPIDCEHDRLVAELPADRQRQSVLIVQLCGRDRRGSPNKGGNWW